MILKKISQFIPHFFLPYFRLIKNIFIDLKSKNLYQIKFNKSNENLIVLGNGPSLDKDLEKIKILTKSSDFFCVNNFACSDLYQKFKPNKYLFLDDYFFSNEAHDDWVLKRNETFKNINNKTNWKIQIFIPSHANIKIFRNQINNPYIQFIKFNTTGITNKSLKINFMYFNTGLFGPYQGNVLIYAIYFGIWSKYKNIKIFGADLSLQENISVDQKTNHLFMNFKHFGNKNIREKFLKNPEKIHPFKMHEFLNLSAETFHAHYVLSKYAKSKKINITNNSNYSLIDSYSRT
jgi:hypothetical protein|tara:strand:+ start:7736 stop:8608 length:873 start_codon:yes stop_codon:yes gene_type:complete